MDRWLDEPMYQEADTGTGSAPVEEPDPAGEGDPEGDPMIPKSRFDDVLKDRSDLSEQNQTLQSQLIETQSKLQALLARDTDRDLGGTAEPTDPSDIEALPPAPKGLSELQAVAWYVRQGLVRDLPTMLSKTLGAPVDQIRAAIEQVPNLGRQSAEAAYSSLCSDVGVDAANPVVRNAFKAMAAENPEGDPRTMLTQIKEQLPGVASEPPAKTGTAITSGVTSPAPGKVIFPRDKDHASKLALAGTRVPEMSVTEIFARSDERRRKRG